jgi:hypothetical protein
MKLEDQVCSLELAKKLKELGVCQKSYFYWEKCPDRYYNFIISCNDHHDTITGEFTYCHSLQDQENYSAFTVSELLNILPAMINAAPFQLLKGLIFGEVNATYCARYYDAGIITEPDRNAANACAKMLIYLIKNEIIDVKDLNNEI